MTASDLVVSVIVVAARVSPFHHIRARGERLAHEWAFWLDVEKAGGWCAAGMRWTLVSRWPVPTEWS